MSVDQRSITSSVSRTAAQAHDLVDSLTSDLAPVQPVSFARIVATAAAIELVVVVLGAQLIGEGISGPGRLTDPSFLAILAVLATGAGASAAAMASMAIPGRAVARSWRVGLLALPLVLAAVVVVVSPWGGTWKGLVHGFVEGFTCTRVTLEIAAPAWIAALLYLRILAPLDPLRVGLFGAFSSLLTAALAMQMACPACDSWHLALSHYAPILVAAWIAAMLSPLVLGLGRPESHKH